MVTTSLFFWLAPGIFAVFAACFLLMAFSQSRYLPPRWAAAGGLLATAGTMIDISRPFDLEGAILISSFLHWSAVALFVHALLLRRSRGLKPAFLAFILAVSTAATTYGLYIHPSPELRIFVNGFAGGALFGSALLQLFPQNRDAIERIVWGFLAICFAIYLARPAYFLLGDGSLLGGLGDAFSNGSMIIFYITTTFIGLGMLLTMTLAMGSDLIRQQYDEARIDSLTGVPNRRAHDDLLEATREGRASIGAVVMVDLDHFKRINDALGHDVGDKVLAAAAAAMRTAVQGCGHFARIGGEEFAFILDETEADSVQRHAYALLGAVRGARVHAALPEVRLTASVGWARRHHDESAQELVRRADQALYEAKRSGRDRIVSRNGAPTTVRLIRSGETAAER